MRITKIRASRASLSVFTIALAGLFTSQNVTGDRMLRLSGHVSDASLRKAMQLGRKNGRERMQLAVVLQLRNQAGLDDFLKRVHDPQDPLYHQFLSPREFTERFAPRDEDVSVVADHLARHGINVKQVHANHLVLDIEGATSDVEQAFQVELQQYRKEDGRLAHATAEDPAMPAEVAARVQVVAGLNNLNPHHSHLRRQMRLENPDSVDPCCQIVPHLTINDFLSPAKIKTAYGLDGISATGAGQSLALFELDGYTTSEITTYVNNFGLPAPNLQNILVDGFSGNPGNGAAEVTLDIELATAIAPNLTKLLVYEGPNTEPGIIDTYNKIATDNLAAQVSTSWGLSEDQSGSAMLSAENTIFQQMAAQGQSMFAASGDSGAFDDGVHLGVDDPASQPFVTGVGGTSLTITTANTYAQEVAWGIPAGNGLPAEGGGGGVSDKWAIPSYQAIVGTNNSGHSSTNRMVPDVALDANPDTGYQIFFGGRWHAFGGTSCAAPLWAAFTSLVNQQRATDGRGRLGFANPPLYQVGQSAQYPAAFHDITGGSTNLFYPSVPDFDLATGWGSFNGASLFSLLTAAALPASLAAPSSPSNLKVTGTN